MKAVVLAAGEGKRLEPLTNLRPKPMIPVANKPLLEYVIEAIAAAGIDEVILVVGYKRERIQSHFGDGDDWGVDLTYAIQRKQLGTGDAVLQAEPYIDEDFLVLNGDQIIDAAAIESVTAARETWDGPLMVVTHSGEPSLYGVIDINDDRVVDIREKPLEPSLTSDLINAGVYAFGPDIFSEIRETEAHGELALTTTLKDRLDAVPIRAVPYDGLWLDVTRPWDLLSVNGRLLDRGEGTRAASAQIAGEATVTEATAIGENATVMPGATVLRGSALGDNVRVGPNAVIQNSLLLSDVAVGPGAVLTDCVVGANVRIGSNTTVAGGEADVVIEDTLHRGVQFGGMLGDNAALGGAVTVEPGALLGNDSVVGTGSLLSGRIEPGSTVRRG